MDGSVGRHIIFLEVGIYKKKILGLNFRKKVQLFLFIFIAIVLVFNREHAKYRKFPKYLDTQNIYCNHSKI